MDNRAERQYQEIVRNFAERTGISEDEAYFQLAKAAGIDVEAIAEVIERIKEGLRLIFGTVTEVADAISRIWRELEESGVFEIEPRARRRRINRERTRAIERRYAVQIKHWERARPYRRIYKPP